MSRYLLAVALCIASPFVIPRVHATALDAKAPDEAAAKIEQALETLTEFQYLDTPLSDVATDLTLRHKIPVQIDKEALSADGLEVDMPLTIDLKDLPLASGLNWLFHGTALDWTIRDEVLLITTREAANQMTVTKVYSIADLATRPEFHSSDLIETLTRLISPEDWQDNGGAIGTVSWNSTMRALVVTTTYREQRNVRVLLELLTRTAAEKPGDDPSAGVSMVPRDKIDAALRSKTTVQYLETFISDVAVNLQLKHGVQFRLDGSVPVSISPHVPLEITALLDNVSLAAALNRILHPKKLDWAVVDGIVLITSSEAMESAKYSQIRLYPIGDLVDLNDWNDSVVELSETLMTVVTPDQWAANGGTKADFLPYAPSHGLVIRHDEQGHRALASLLRQLRTAKEQAPAAAASEDEQLTVKFYPIADLDGAFRVGEKEALQSGQAHFVDDAAVLVRTLLQEVRPDSWQKTKEGTGPSVLVDRLTRSLVVRQTARGHRDVAGFLDKVRHDLDPTHVGTTSGMGAFY